ncbi:hypothetical protein K3N28_04250 [Glycomyces sp. TRM65418]|uniref:LppM family (lipo)protein n=1 Tax=Glycomyces sp. TRM65418 TaxID=2867006 RepID=UPI001CE4EBD8|nr:hypothetical protein [Glycomyces sp. TRM65418]MCC3762281.1 hypothetical protein [Glycomyces sp. TRM65418]QZD56337.1 hypothetical protein K3N28_04220 [Glycomyces sp. TRM65418]
MPGLAHPIARRALAVCAALGLLVTASGCLRLDLGLQIRSDDTVGGTFTAAWSEEFLERADEEGLDRAQLDAFLDALLDGVPGTERTAYDEHGYVGRTATFTDRPLAEFAELGGDEWGYLRLDHTGRHYELEGHWDLRTAGFLDPETFDDAEILLSVNFPARVTEHNGALDGRTVTWTMTPGEEYELSAVAVENDGRAFLIAGVAFAVLACALLWLWQWTRLRRYSVGDRPD